VRFYLRSAAGLVLAVKAQPGARRIQIGPALPAAPVPGWPEARLKIAINAPPEDGRANEAIIGALAAWLHVKPGDITLVAGAAAREKKFLVAGAVQVPDI